ncbi:hypothetical protein [Miltoncostaea marina]|uniref:hypothetical protein n=1 Tax=Miltoncostaea marina TaxID=2843215 RepID=UPI001C3CDE7E|nr:hypothetical protein [Miltoncostaea marina]
MSAPAPAFDPGSVRAFRFAGARADWATGEVRLGYALEPGHAFTETFRFPLPAGSPPDPARRWALDAAVRLLHLVAGVSYYKAAVPPRIEVEGEPPSPEAARALERLWRGGLAEFAWRNRLPGVGRAIAFPAGRPAPEAAPTLGAGPRSLVPVGGGKDSVVSLAALARAGEDVLAFSVGRKASADAAARIEAVPMLHVERELDPALFALNRAGALNGHVPVTAIVTCAAIVAALLHGCDAVVMSNERSASAGSFEWPEYGGVVNHQHSKGWGSERDLAELVRREVAGDLRVFSLLRPWSELAISRAFAALPEHHGTFMSCNRVFRIDRPAASGWCGECPKCRFVFLALAPFTPREALVGTFGRDLLDDPAGEDGYRAILGIDADKPFECVGEVDEARAAMRALAASPQWAGAAIVERLGPLAGPPDPGAVAPWLTPAGEHAIPERHLRAAGALLGP